MFWIHRPRRNSAGAEERSFAVRTWDEAPKTRSPNLTGGSGCSYSTTELDATGAAAILRPPREPSQ